MALFRKRKAPQAGAGLPARDPLDAVPLVAEGVEARADSRGRIQLKRTWQPAGGVRGFLARTLKYEHSARLDLDEPGSAYWRLVDGRRTLREMAAALARDSSRSEDECRKATILFTRSLMVRHFVNLKVAERED
jgi:hypothetical protein